MSPEAKEVLDYLVTFSGVGSVGGILLAFFGWLKAKAERPPVAQPAVPPSGLAQIGGMVLGQQQMQDFIEALRGVAASHDRCTLAREAEMETMKQLAKERRAHENDLARERHAEQRALCDAVLTLNDRLRNLRCAD
ncbi:hypothetical protein [Methylobacterium oxalidis]|uniref:hypothetical protein n=1 Tax=Methylobacterium oxalidis TaxID=944322 RepID=UPI0033161E3D